MLFLLLYCCTWYVCYNLIGSDGTDLLIDVEILETNTEALSLHAYSSDGGIMMESLIGPILKEQNLMI